MNILLTNNKAKSIAYHKSNSTKNKAPYVVFHHGLMSDMNGTKVLWLEEYCKRKDYNFIRFDNFGHGKSSGEFKDQTVTDWLEGFNMVLDELVDGPVILVGSSMGAWVVLLTALQNSVNNVDIMGVVGLASAADFSEELIWNQISEQEKKALKDDGIAFFKKQANNCDLVYPISFKLIEDGRKYLLLNQDNIDIKCPVHLIHGMNDKGVPADISKILFDKINSENLVLKLIKGADHALSRESDMNIIANSIEELMNRSLKKKF